MPSTTATHLRHAARVAALLAVLAPLSAGGLYAATITVDTASDSGPPMDGLCSLREAIDAANQNAPAPGGDCPAGEPAPVRDVIEFAIPGAGVHTILPATLLPEVTETVLIDGYSQPGASPNTLAVGSDAVLRIEIDGSLMPFPPYTRGIMLSASDCEVRGLAIGAFIDGIVESIQIFDQNSVVVGNFLGTDASGTVAVPNQRGAFLRGSGSRLGGPAPADRNVLAANNNQGAVIQGPDFEVLGNYVGVDPSGTVALPNGEGVRVEGGPSAIGAAGAGNLISGNLGAGINLSAALDVTILGNWIGTDATGAAPLGNQVGIWATSIPSASAMGSEIGNPTAGNVIAFNVEDGIRIGPECSRCGVPQSGHRISGNSIHANGGLGIDLLGIDGVDVAAGSDPLDADAGPNGLQNRPVLASAADDGAVLEIDWSLDSAADTAYAVEFYYSAECDPAGAGEGEVFLGLEQVTTDSAGSVQVLTSLPSPGAPGAITATATDLDTDDTSELSDCVVLGEGPPQEIPTLSPWGTALLVLLLIAGALLSMRRLASGHRQPRADRT